MRLTAGQEQIAANRNDTFEHGLNPEIWREASDEGMFRIDPAGDGYLELGSILGISIDVSNLKLPFIVGSALNKITRGGPLEFESQVTEMVDAERILVTGNIAIASMRLTIDLEDHKNPHGSFRNWRQTLAAYTLDINLTGKLAPFDRSLAGLRPIVKPEADRFVKKLRQGIESSVTEAA